MHPQTEAWGWVVFQLQCTGMCLAHASFLVLGLGAVFADGQVHPSVW